MNTDICESCEFAAYDDETGELVCEALLDEDEAYAFTASGWQVCRYYKPYDEYKTVRRQN